MAHLSVCMRSVDGLTAAQTQTLVSWEFFIIASSLAMTYMPTEYC